MIKILIVEDDTVLNQTLAFNLKMAGYQVISAYTMEQARGELTGSRFDLAVLDVNLPDGSGLEAVRYARERSSVHIICLTALDGEIDQVMGYESGADDYVTKPFSLSVLTLKIRAFFSRQEGNFADIAEYGKLKIDLTSMKIWNGEDEISLTKNEWKLLRLFLQNPGQVLSKNQILEYALDTEVNFSDENTVAVNIRRLRSKIEEDSSRPKYIKNIRGLGYVWDSSNSTEGGRER